MSGPAKTDELDRLLHPVQVAKLLGVSSSWLAKSRLNGTDPRFVKIGRAVRYAQSAVRDFILASSGPRPRKGRADSARATSSTARLRLDWARPRL